MNRIYNHYIIDISSNNNFVQIPTIQGDGNNVRGFEIELIENDRPYIINRDDCVISIMGVKPDTKEIVNECQLTDEGYILVDITSQMSAVNGRGDYQIVLMSRSTNSQLKSFPFYILTTPAAFDIDYVTSSDEFQLLTRRIVQADFVTDNANQAISDIRELEASVSDAESSRTTAEENRVNAENIRNSDENIRKSNEEIRISNENLRKTNEEDRISAEAERLASEENRITNEETRDQNESERISNENIRSSAETDRIFNENIRIDNENVRIDNENNREDAEANRKIDTAAAITNAGNATTNANTATQNAENATEAANTATRNANTATQQANTLIEQMKSLIKDDNVVHTSAKGTPNGVATLDENGNVPASQLPSFVDDAVEGTAVHISVDETTGSKSAKEFILTGDTEPCMPESGKIYIDINENVTYRWTGSIFVSIGSSLSLGENSSTAFPGDRGLSLEGRVSDIEEYHNNIPASDIKFDNSDTPLLGANVQSAVEALTQTATQTSPGLLSADDKKKIDNYADLQEKEILLQASNWVENESSFTQIITVEDLLSYNNCSIEVSPNATPSQITAITNASPTSVKYDESIGLTFTVYGERPTVDIPIILCVGTSMNVVEVPRYMDTPNSAVSISYDNVKGNAPADNVQGALDDIYDKLSIIGIKEIKVVSTLPTDAASHTDILYLITE